jgi:hypothetical protein
MISILDSIPAIAASKNSVISWIPLLFVVGVSILREFVEDKKR